MTTPSRNDAAPIAVGACVTDSDTSPQSIQPAAASTSRTTTTGSVSAPATMPPAHHNAPRGTSDVAARRIRGAVPRLLDRVLTFLASCGVDGATDDEGETALKMKPQTYTPRRGELVRAGLVVDTGQRRSTTSGRPAAVWMVTAQAIKNTEGGRA